MGENFSKLYDWWMVNTQNVQMAQTAQYLKIKQLS